MDISRLEDAADASEITAVLFTKDTFTFELSDKRKVTAPIWWYPRLQSATPKQRQDYQILPGGDGVHWPDVDEDISLLGLFIGGPAPGAVMPVLDAAE